MITAIIRGHVAPGCKAGNNVQSAAEAVMANTFNVTAALGTGGADRGAGDDERRASIEGRQLCRAVVLSPSCQQAAYQ